MAPGLYEASLRAMCGHVKFAGELLRRDRELIMAQDSHGFTPLHLASARQCPSMVKKLLDSNSDACMVQDNERRTPLHLAATKDRVNIMKALINLKPEAIHFQNGRNETILHLCVKHNSLNALKFLVEDLPSAGSPTLNNLIRPFINSRNIDGNTILHLAVQMELDAETKPAPEMKRMKFIKYLVESKDIGIDIDTLNNEHVKALHMFPEAERDGLEIGWFDHKRKKTNPSDQQRWMLEKVNALMVVATLVAGIAFTAAMNPPGGVFQEDSKIKASENPVIFTYYLRSVAKSTKSGRFGRYLDQQELTQSQNMMNSTDFLQDLLTTLDNDTYTAYSPYVMGKSPGIVLGHEKWNKIISKYKLRFSPYLIRYAGTPVLAYRNPRIYNLYMTYNAIAFLVSLSIIVLVISGFIDTEKTTNHQVRVLIGMMVVSITAWLLSFISVFISMSPPFYINHPLLSQAFIISIVTLVICTYGYNFLMKAKHLITILWWKIMHKDRLIDQFQKEDSALHSDHMSLMTKGVFLKFMPVFYLILLATLSLPFLYGYTNRA
ncbi:uncharacterized protein LOC113350400 isoform X2 [Papaver somniferum]|uniref:uncharacterized protein LOC113350400 isoform X2 n=1 Tax=Papaver somniferum TaxID=3469 RepID=UPI000E6FCA9F|nr:uncharacterized protein LOC113350400 isoform X2 [Papaver somniferum]